MKQQRKRPVQRAGWLRRQLAKRPLPLWILIVTDLLLFVIALLVFALFHHVLPSREQPIGLTSQRVSTAAGAPVSASTPAATAVANESVPAASATPETASAADAMAQAPVPTPEPTPEPVGYFGSKFADKFTAGEIVQQGNVYQSANVNVVLDQMREYDSNIYVADIYIRDIACLQSAFSKETYGRGYNEYPSVTAKRIGSIVAVNGDFYGGRRSGVVVRNGVLYRNDESTQSDLCVLYWDGTMETYSPEGFDAETEMARGAYQVWNFGPMLLDANGQPMTTFNSRVKPENPRTAIGYYEPGHYCFVVVDGRSGSSQGLKMVELSQLMYDLGCVRAYNLDGGQSSQMVCGSVVVNNPYDGGRATSDVVAILDGAIEQEVKTGDAA